MAIRVKDPAEFERDPVLARFRGDADLLEGQLPQDPAPCFALARGLAPRPPPFKGLQRAAAGILERSTGDLKIDDA